MYVCVCGKGKKCIVFHTFYVMAAGTLSHHETATSVVLWPFAWTLAKAWQRTKVCNAMAALVLNYIFNLSVRAAGGEREGVAKQQAETAHSEKEKGSKGRGRVIINGKLSSIFANVFLICSFPK